jgi:3'-phosphoadenosine 5'-phosphosulfate sulfotransferase (PAPS reductase)/FAD synthetase
MIDLNCARVRSKMPSYKRKIEKAVEIIREGLEICKNPYVACSFGKDSSVLLHMVMQIDPKIEARFIAWPESELIHNFSEVINQWLLLGANIKRLDLNRSSLDDKVADRFDILSNMSESDGSFVGLRADESKGRRITLVKDGVIYKNKQGFYRICPLAWFSTEDIAAYIYQHNLPTLKIYKDGGFNLRTTSRIPRPNFGIREEMLRGLKRRDPWAFQKLIEIYPEVKEYE